MIDTRRAMLSIIALTVLMVVACESICACTEIPPTQTATSQVSPTVDSTRNVSPTVTPRSSISPTPVADSPTATVTPAPVPTENAVRIPVPQFVDNPDCQSVSRNQLPLADVIITDGTLSVVVVAEMARSSAEQSQGLMCRSSVPDGTGMLFLWDTERTGGFWMFNTYVPLDIIYFGGQDGDVSIVQMTPCPRDSSAEDDNTWSSRCGAEAANYLSGISYTTALELPQGWLEQHGFDTSEPAEIGVSLIARN